jgi:uridine nucleosidase
MLLPNPVAQAAEPVAGTIATMYDALSTYPGRSWLISTGALTNIALLFAVYPQLVDRIAGLSIMGGAIGGFFSHAPLGRLDNRLQFRKNIHRDFPSGLPDDSGMTIPEVAKHFKELGILKGTEDLEDDKINLILQQARFNFGNSSPFAEFNVCCRININLIHADVYQIYVRMSISIVSPC